MQNDSTSDPTGPVSAIPADDPTRRLTIARPDDPGLPCVALVGDTYTVLISGEETAGRYCLIDMNVPPGGGPPPHRHDFEEMFAMLDGEIELTFRGETHHAGTGTVVNIPANAPHRFRNTSDRAAHLLCLCAPPGQEDFFLAVGDPLESRDSPPPPLSEADKAERRARAQALAAKFHTELLGP